MSRTLPRPTRGRSRFVSVTAAGRTPPRAVLSMPPASFDSIEWWRRGSRIPRRGQAGRSRLQSRADENLVDVAEGRRRIEAGRELRVRERARGADEIAEVAAAVPGLHRRGLHDLVGRVAAEPLAEQREQHAVGENEPA